ncbi:C2H2-type zinc finger protein CYBJADRAFT_130223, partial [Cyberlindnera jadinii NRRL Y-1542]
KPHQCPLCGGIFQRPEHLKRHMRSHSSEKPFECDECGKKFNRADNMKAHQRKLHGRDI